MSKLSALQNIFPPQHDSDLTKFSVIMDEYRNNRQHYIQFAIETLYADDETAEDLVQETFFSSVENLSQWDEETPVTTFIQNQLIEQYMIDLEQKLKRQATENLLSEETTLSPEDTLLIFQTISAKTRELLENTPHITPKELIALLGEIYPKHKVGDIMMVMDIGPDDLIRAIEKAGNNKALNRFYKSL
ncbi:MAG: hypothetical protein KDI46_06970 [Alphaproteobacteria bacterium]|nr:hypothetical protein [Alphaproteobacteria bacterium]